MKLKRYGYGCLATGLILKRFATQVPSWISLGFMVMSSVLMLLGIRSECQGR